VREALRDPGFNKIAEYGIKNKVIKTVTMFISKAVSLNNFKYFDTEQDALKWLKEK